MSSVPGGSAPPSRNMGAQTPVRGLRSLEPSRPATSEAVARARKDGYASTHGEVEPGAHDLAVPLRRSGAPLAACVNVITYRSDVAERAVRLTIDAIRRVDLAVA